MSRLIISIAFDDLDHWRKIQLSNDELLRFNTRTQRNLCL